MKMIPKKNFKANNSVSSSPFADQIEYFSAN